MSRRGDWKITCDRCGDEIWASESHHEWTGLIVCAADFDRRNPGEFGPLPSKPMSVPWTRPEGPDVFVEVAVSREDL